MSQDEHLTEVRTCTTQGENKRRKQQGARASLRQPSATAPTRRDTPERSKTKSPFCVVLKTYHLTGIHHKTCLKHSNSSTENCVFNCYQHGTPWQQQRDREQKEKNKIRQNELRQGSTHGNYNMHLAWLGVIPNCVQFFKSSDSASPMGFASFSRGFKSWSARKQDDCCIEPNCYEWNACQHKMRKQGK